MTALRACLRALPQRRRRRGAADFEAFRAEQGERCCASPVSKCCAANMRHAVDRNGRSRGARRRASDSRASRRRMSPTCEFHEFMQWIADRQLARLQGGGAQAQGMPIGLYIDVAVGIDPARRGCLEPAGRRLSAVSVGAPPDEFNPARAGLGPGAVQSACVADERFRADAAVARGAMRHAGAIRLDHVLGLKRVYHDPARHAASDGAYVRFPFEQLLRVVAEESVRYRCIVIGEDLGTVPEGFRDTMAKWGLWTYRVMLFERERRRRVQAAGGLSGRGARDLQHARPAELPRLDGTATTCDVKRVARLRSRRERRCAQRAQSVARDAAGARGQGYRARRFAAAAGFLGATPSRLVADRARRHCSASPSRSNPGHGRRTSELAAQAAGAARGAGGSTMRLPAASARLSPQTGRGG